MAVLCARFVSLGAAAVQLPLLTRTLPPEQYGAVALAMALSTYFALASAEPATLAFQRHPGEPHHDSSYAYALGRVVPGIVAVSMIVVGVAFIFGEQDTGIAVAGWGAGLAVARYTATAWLMWGRHWSYAVNLMLSTGLRTIVLATVVLAGVPGLPALALAGLVSALISLILAPKVSWSRLWGEPRPWPRSLGYLLAGASLGVTVLTSSNIVALGIAAGPNVTAEFAAMSQLSMYTTAAIVSMVLTVMYPHVRRIWDLDQHRSANRLMQRAQLTVVFVGTGSISTLTALDGILTELIVPADLVDLSALTVLLLASTFAGLGQVSGWQLQLRLRARALVIRTTAAAIFGVVVLVALLGATDLPPVLTAAYGTLFGFVLYFALVRGRGGWRGPSLNVLTFGLLALAVVAPFASAGALSASALSLASVAALVAFISRKARLDAL